jgi:hypothetical protein
VRDSYEPVPEVIPIGKRPNNFILVRRWGEYIMIFSRQFLAIRCLSYINMDFSELWVSLNIEMVEYFINYIRKAGLDLSAPSQLSLFMFLIDPAKTAFSLN